MNVLGQCFPASLLKAVAEVDDAAAESVLVDELKIGARVGRQSGVAPTEDSGTVAYAALVGAVWIPRIWRGAALRDHRPY